MLRASIEYQGKDGDLRAVTEGTKAGDSGVTHGDELVAFAEAAVGSDAAALATARDALRAAAGSEGLVDAAGVVGNFQRMVRIADSTGIPVDAPVAALSDDFRKEIGLDDFATADRIHDLGVLGRAAAAVGRRVAFGGLRLFGKRSRAKDATR